MAYIVYVSDNIHGTEDRSPFRMKFEFKDKRRDEVFTFVRSMVDQHEKCVRIFHKPDTEEERIHEASEAIFSDQSNAFRSDGKKGE